MTNIPTLVGDRYLCFEVISSGRGWSGPYGQNWSGPIWRCVECGHQIAEHLSGLDRARAAKHHEHGHAPCGRCGEMLLLRKDGTPREHPWHRCAGKHDGFRIEREYRKNITTRELTP